MGVQIKSVFEVLSKSDLEGVIEPGSVDVFELPKRATEFSAGYDLANLNDYVIPAHTSKLITFGYSIEITDPFVTGVIVPRSSLAKKNGLIAACGPQYIHSGTKFGFIFCTFINITDHDVELRNGERIAQVVFIRAPKWLNSKLGCVIPDPLDETIMSPAFKDNLESIAMWGPSNEQPFLIDQEDLFSYMFQSPQEVVLEPGKVTCIMTKVRCKVDPGQVFILQNAFYNPCVELANTIGVIDSDYYDNPDNGGEIGVLLINRGCQPITVKVGDVIAKGSIFYYAKTDEDVYGGKRTGGFGSTSK